MMRLWWTQIKAVVRLEMKKTFFAKRGLWVYLLAFMPFVLFVGHAIDVEHRKSVRASLVRQSTKQITQQDLASIKEGMPQQEVVERLGKPPMMWKWNQRRQIAANSVENVVYEDDHYADSEDDLFVHFENGKVTGASLNQGDNFGEDLIVFAGIFQFFYVRLAVFFGCLGIFMNLFRGELLDKSLHFYFLAPIRREVLMAGKYLAGLLAATVIFTTSEALQILIFAWHFDPNVLSNYIYHGHAAAHAAAYLGITVLACVGYGSLFLAAGLVFRNPIFPAAGILLWEGINPFLPTVLQKISIIYYLRALCPVAIPVAPGTPPVLALLVSNADPIAAGVAIFGVLLVSSFVLFMSGLQVRKMQIDYTTE